MACKPSKKQMGGPSKSARKKQFGGPGEKSFSAGMSVAGLDAAGTKRKKDADAAREKRNYETAQKAKIPFSGRLVPPTGYKKTKK